MLSIEEKENTFFLHYFGETIRSHETWSVRTKWVLDLMIASAGNFTLKKSYRHRKLVVGDDSLFLSDLPLQIIHCNYNHYKVWKDKRGEKFKLKKLG